jgi:hypothetical protein
MSSGPPADGAPLDPRPVYGARPAHHTELCDWCGRRAGWVLSPLVLHGLPDTVCEVCFGSRYPSGYVIAQDESQ